MTITRLSAVLALSLTASVAAASTPTLIENDYGRALAEARQRHLPLVIEVWAPW